MIRVSRSQTHESRQTQLLHLSNQTHLFVISSSLLSISAPPCSALQLLPNHFSVQVQSVLRLVYVLVSLKHSNCLMFLSCTSMQARTKARYVFSANGKCSQCAAGVQLFQTLHIMRHDDGAFQEATADTLARINVTVSSQSGRLLSKPLSEATQAVWRLVFLALFCFYFMLESVYFKSLHRRIRFICGAAE